MPLHYENRKHEHYNFYPRGGCACLRVHWATVVAWSHCFPSAQTVSIFVLHCVFTGTNWNTCCKSRVTPDAPLLMMTPPPVMDSSGRWAAELMTVKRLISNNARWQLDSGGEQWESNGVAVNSPPSHLLPFLSLYNPSSEGASAFRIKKKTPFMLFCLPQSHFIWRYTNSIRVILCALHGSCGGRGKGKSGGPAPNANKRARLCLSCPVRWEGEKAG